MFIIAQCISCCRNTINSWPNICSDCMEKIYIKQLKKLENKMNNTIVIEKDDVIEVFKNVRPGSTSVFGKIRMSDRVSSIYLEDGEIKINCLKNRMGKVGSIDIENDIMELLKNIVDNKKYCILESRNDNTWVKLFVKLKSRNLI